MADRNMNKGTGITDLLSSKAMVLVNVAVVVAVAVAAAVTAVVVTLSVTVDVAVPVAELVAELVTVPVIVVVAVHVAVDGSWPKRLSKCDHHRTPQPSWTHLQTRSRRSTYHCPRTCPQSTLRHHCCWCKFRRRLPLRPSWTHLRSHSCCTNLS